MHFPLYPIALVALLPLFTISAPVADPDPEAEVFAGPFPFADPEPFADPFPLAAPAPTPFADPLADMDPTGDHNINGAGAGGITLTGSQRPGNDPGAVWRAQTEYDYVQLLRWQNEHPGQSFPGAYAHGQMISKGSTGGRSTWGDAADRDPGRARHSLWGGPSAKNDPNARPPTAVTNANPQGGPAGKVDAKKDKGRSFSRPAGLRVKKQGTKGKRELSADPLAAVPTGRRVPRASPAVTTTVAAAPAATPGGSVGGAPLPRATGSPRAAADVAPRDEADPEEEVPWATAHEGPTSTRGVAR